MKTIKLTKTHRGLNSTMFIGRIQGNRLREELNLNQCDKDNGKLPILGHPLLDGRQQAPV